MSIQTTTEDLLALLKIEAGKAAKEYGKGETGTCEAHLERVEELTQQIKSEL